jgi:hypothetical protein
MINRIRIIFILSVGVVTLFSQQSLSVKPYSFENELLRQEIPVEILPELNIDLLLEEDNQPGVKPFRYGYRHEVILNTTNSGVWDVLENGDAIWRLKIKSQDAYNLSLIFSNLNLPAGSMFHIYKEVGGEFFGGYSSFNNSDYFSTPLVEGDYCIIEYFEPSNADYNANLEIVKVVHDYRNFYDMISDDRDACGMNVVCNEADPYEDQINASAHLDMGGYICSGAMINNTANDLTPYFLTANHCTQGENTSSFRFYFNYQRTTCSATNWGNMGSYAYGSQMKWASNDSNGSNGISENDVSLLEITGTIYESWEVYYAGWNISTNSTQSASVSVHHPNGEPKQISFSNQTTYTNGWDAWGTHWKVYWNCVDGQGCGTEGGSSGSPIFDGNGRILGPLSGGPDVACGASSDYALYGKLNNQWSSIDQFLDPTNSGVTFLNGIYDSVVSGCTDPVADNFDSDATQDDGSCEYTSVGDAILTFGAVSGNIFEIILQNSVPVGGFQFVVSDTPDILSLLGAEGGSSTSAGFMLSTSEAGTILGFSMVGGTIPSGVATMLSLTFSGSGETELCLSDAIISDGSGEGLSTTYGGCVTYAGGISGDINGDNMVNILDVVQMVNIILGTMEPTPAQNAAADLNGDNSVNILDIVLVVNIILGD